MKEAPGGLLGCKVRYGPGSPEKASQRGIRKVSADRPACSGDGTRDVPRGGDGGPSASVLSRAELSAITTTLTVNGHGTPGDQFGLTSNDELLPEPFRSRLIAAHEGVPRGRISGLLRETPTEEAARMNQGWTSR